MLRATLAVLICSMGVTGLMAEDKPVQVKEKPALPAADKDGWRPLIDAKTLKNWKSTNFGGEGEVTVEQGVLTMKAGEPLTGITWAGGDLPKSNYEIELEAMRVQGGDFFCALTVPVKESACSYVLGGWGGSVIGISSIGGFDASENETTDYHSFDDNKWYKLRMKVTDTTIETWLDGTRVANVDYSEKKIDVRIEVEVSRPLGVSTFQTAGAIRNLKLRELAK